MITGGSNRKLNTQTQNDGGITSFVVRTLHKGLMSACGLLALMLALVPGVAGMTLTVLLVAAIVLLNLLRLKTRPMETVVNERSRCQPGISGNDRVN